MQKTITIVDEKRGIVQCTTLSERWYAVPSKDPVTNLPTYEYYPSSSWVAGYDYMPPQLLDWAKKNGTEADQIMIEAAARGSKIHHAIEKIIAGEKLEMDTKVYNGQSGQEEGLTTDEWEVIKTFVDWNNEVKPEYILSEKTVISHKYKYGGTLDCVAKIADKVYLIDFKTSKAIYTSHRVQIASYKHALMEEDERFKDISLAVLQVGYRLNRKGWKFTEIEDAFPRFQRDYATWKDENPDAKPRQIDLPIAFEIDNSMKKLEDKLVDMSIDKEFQKRLPPLKVEPLTQSKEQYDKGKSGEKPSAKKSAGSKNQ